MSNLLNTRQAAQALGLAPKTLIHWRWSGKGPTYIKLGGAIRYRREALDSFVALCERVTDTTGTAGLKRE